MNIFILLLVKFVQFVIKEEFGIEPRITQIGINKYVNLNRG